MGPFPDKPLFECLIGVVDLSHFAPSELTKMLEENEAWLTAACTGAIIRELDRRNSKRKAALCNFTLFD